MAKKAAKQVERKDRRPTISGVDFLKAYLKAVKDEKTVKELAAELGRDAQWVAQKATNMRKSLAKAGKELPSLKRPNRSNVEDLANIFDELS